ncbi:MAG TPA: DUF3833 family protein [Sphingomicrobium sp.]|nr:DUF3833 family protein [Sphingomicrobium sp.]
MAGAAALAVTLLPSAAVADSDRAPLQFFNGKTEMVSTVKVIMKKPFRSRAIGNGRILPDGTLSLAQQVFDEGEPTRQRHWKIRKVASSHYAGTMTEAVGPVMVDEVDGRYRFKFRMKGNLSVEQWVTPLAGGISAKSNTTVRKFGMKVASSTGFIKRV